MCRVLSSTAEDRVECIFASFLWFLLSRVFTVAIFDIIFDLIFDIIFVCLLPKWLKMN